MSAKGYYKYNISLLRNIEYVSETKQSVSDIKGQSEIKIVIIDKPRNSLKGCLDQLLLNIHGDQQKV